MKTAIVGEDLGFAVLELFTSQGCVHSPGSDVLLRGLKEEFGDRLFTLAFHVDYWNAAGWSDPFSNAQCSRRQQQYAGCFGSKELCTPQAIVNGRRFINGGDAHSVRELISEGLVGTTGCDIQLQLQPSTGPANALTVAYNAALKSGEVLNIALVQRTASTMVRGGLNVAHRLQNSSIVRAFRTVKKSQGSVEMAFPDRLPPDAFQIIGYTQRTRDMHITGACKVTLI